MTVEPLASVATSGDPSIPELPRRRGELALALQEAFTVAVRLRTRRQVATDAPSFRAHIKRLLAAADAQAREAGYDSGDVRLAVYAFIAFLDESVLNSGQTMFAEWPRQPLQEEVFGDHVAGENFFRHLRELLSRPDSESVADVLEVFQLALLLGFRGRFAADAAGHESVMRTVQEKMGRIRRGSTPLAPAWALPANEKAPRTKDPWLRGLLFTVVAATILAVVLYIVFHFSLAGDLDELARLRPGAT